MVEERVKPGNLFFGPSSLLRRSGPCASQGSPTSVISLQPAGAWLPVDDGACRARSQLPVQPLASLHASPTTGNLKT